MQPPLQFGVLESNLYKGGAPIASNFPYLLTLKLKVGARFFFLQTIDKNPPLHSLSLSLSLQ